MYKSAKGFTIVELLIVIVIIAILASITIVAYNGVQNRANDTAVQTDLRNLRTIMLVTSSETNVYPNTENGIKTLGFRVSKSSYGNPIVSGSGGYNLLYCSTVTGVSPSKFAFVASSKSKNSYIATDTKGVEDLPSTSWVSGWGTICPAALGVSYAQSAGIWLYDYNNWRSWL